VLPKGGAPPRDALGTRKLLTRKESLRGSSSRETAPYAEKVAGARLIVAETIEKIYGQNCTNIGLLTTTDFGILERIENGLEIPIDEFTKGLDPISADIVRMGGLFEYSKARLAGRIAAPAVTTKPRPMTMVEKICAAHVVTGPDAVGVPAVKPGDAVFLRTDVRFTHEYVTPMAESLFKAAYGADAKVTDPGSGDDRQEARASDHRRRGRPCPRGFFLRRIKDSRARTRRPRSALSKRQTPPRTVRYAAQLLDPDRRRA